MNEIIASRNGFLRVYVRVASGHGLAFEIWDGLWGSKKWYIISMVKTHLLQDQRDQGRFLVRRLQRNWDAILISPFLELLEGMIDLPRSVFVRRDTYEMLLAHNTNYTRA